ncbi:unnamed protein product [Vitrella brassicaformis CCMP3155]|uniref:Uncharacterized protein n=3 Tax=Vitrella brassicaformis TaxID=1169539 RepID=A0A0G4F5N5_VITBC|nr:unnamed protein product [Vitrella brassicaformis CCMP3155]|eukprot:CEM07275.1 unnamed protein product [Vitrella brassicaformis CCMP3155]
MQRLDLFPTPMISDDEVESPLAFLQAVRQHGIDVIKTPPSSNRDYPASVRRSPRFGIDSDDDHNTECESTGRRSGAPPRRASPDRFVTARRGQGSTGERLFISDTTSVSEGPTPSTTARGVQSQQAWQNMLLQTVGTVQEDEQGNDDEHDPDEPIPSLSISSMSLDSVALSNCERLAMDVDHMLTRRSADGGLSMMTPLPGHHRSSLHQGGGVGIVTTSDSDSLAYSEEPVTLDDVQPSPQVRLKWPDSVLAELSDRLKDEMQADDDFDLDPPTDADHLKSPEPLAEPRPEPDVPHAASPMIEENHHASRVTPRQPESDHSPAHEQSPQDHHSATSAADDGSPHDKTPNTASDTVTPVSRRMLWWIRSTPVSPYHGGSTRDTTYRQHDEATRPLFPLMRSEAGAKKRRRRRVMLFACGGVMVLLLTLALVGIYGILPGVVQRSLDKSSLVLDAIYISNPSLSGKGGYGFDLAVSGSMQRPEGLARSVRVTTKPFRLEIYGVVSENHSRPMITDNSTNRSGLGGSSSSDLPMGSLEAPPMVLEGSPAPLTLESRVRVDDSTSFDAFTYLLMARPGEQAASDGLGWRFVGLEGLDIKVELPFGAIDLPFHINSLKYERYLPIDAMGGSLGAALAADGVELSDLELKGEDEIGKGVDLSLTVVFHNPNKLSIETLGNVHLALAYKALPIGELVASSASLKSGRNTWRLKGRLEPASRLADGTDGRAPMSEMVTAILKQEKPVVAAKGKHSSLPIFSSAVSALDLTLPFGASTTSGSTGRARAIGEEPLVQSFRMTSFNIDFNEPVGAGNNRTADNTTHVVGLTGHVAVVVVNPLGVSSPIRINHVEMVADLHSVPDGELPVNLGRLRATLRELHNQDEATAAHLLPSTPHPEALLELNGLLDLAGDGEPFGEFVQHFMANDEVTLLLENGVANVTAATALGVLDLPGLSIDITPEHSTPLKGLGGMKGISLEGFQVTEVDSDGSWVLAANVSIPNPSAAEVPIPPGARFEMTYQGVQLGYFDWPVDDRGEMLPLQPGNNSFTLEGKFEPETEDEGVLDRVEDFFSDYVSGRSPPIDIKMTSGPTRAQRPLPGASRSGGKSAQREESVPGWFSAAINAFKFTTAVRPPTAMVGVGQQQPGPANLIETVDLSQVQLQLEPSEGVAVAEELADRPKVWVVGPLVVIMRNPVGSPEAIKVDAVKWNITLTPLNGATSPLGWAFLPWTSATDVHHVAPSPLKRGEWIKYEQGQWMNMTLPVAAPLVGYSSAALSDFVVDFFNEKKTDLRIDGSAEVAIQSSFGEMTLEDVTVESSLSLTGMQGLAGTRVTNLTIAGAQALPSGDGYALGLTLKATLRNPSSASIRLGRLTLDLVYGDDGETFGEVEAADVNIRPGESETDFAGAIMMTPKTAGALSRFLSDLLDGREPPLRSQLRSSDQSLLPWLADALQEVTLQPSLNTSDLREQFLPAAGSGGLISDATFANLSLWAVNGTHVSLAGDLSVVAFSPLTDHLAFTIQHVGIDGALLWARNGTQTSLGQLQLAPTRPSQVGINGTESLGLALPFDALLALNEVHSADEGTLAFGDFVATFAREGLVDMVLDGKADIGVTVKALGNDSEALDPLALNLTGLSLNLTSSLGQERPPDSQGLGVDLQKLTFTGEAPTGGIAIETAVEIRNPADATIDLGPVTLGLLIPCGPSGDANVTLGSVGTDALRLRPGSNVLTLRGAISPDKEDLPHVSEAFSTSVGGGAIPMRVVPVRGEGAPWISQVLENMQLTTTLPSISQLQAGATDANATARAGLVRQVTLVSFNLDLGSVMGVRRVLMGRRLQAATLPVSGQLEASVSNVFGSEVPLNVTSIAISTLLEFDGEPFGRLIIPRVTIAPSAQRTSSDGKSLNLTIELDGSLKLIDDGRGFVAVTDQLLNRPAGAPPSPLSANGYVSVAVDTPIGLLDLKGLPLSNELPLGTREGEGGGDALSVNITSFEIGGGGPEAVEYDTDRFVTIDTAVTLGSVLGVGLSFGQADIALSMEYANQTVGELQTTNGVTIRSGGSTEMEFAGALIRTKSNEAALTQLLEAAVSAPDPAAGSRLRLVGREVLLPRDSPAKEVPEWLVNVTRKVAMDLPVPSTSSDGKSLNLTIELDGSLKLIDDGRGFVAVTDQLLNRPAGAPPSPLSANGYVSVAVDTPIGLLDLKGLPLSNELPLGTREGEGGGDALSVNITSFEIGGGGPEAVEYDTDRFVTIDTAVTLGSDLGVGLSFGQADIALSMEYANQTVGELQTTNGVTIRSGGSTEMEFAGALIRTKSNEAALTQLLEAAVSAPDPAAGSRLRLVGREVLPPRDSPAKEVPEWLVNVTRKVAMDLPVPSLGEPSDLLQEVELLSLSLGPLANESSKASLELRLDLTLGGPLDYSGLGLTFNAINASIALASSDPADTASVHPIGLAVVSSSDTLAMRLANNTLRANFTGILDMDDDGNGLATFARLLLGPNTTHTTPATLGLNGTLDVAALVGRLGVPVQLRGVSITQLLRFTRKDSAPRPASMAVRPFGAPTAAAAAAAAAGGLAIRLSEVDFTGAVAGGGLGVKTVALVDNPSLAQVTLGDVAFVLTLPATTEGEAPVVLGSVGGKGVHLPSGRSKIHLTGQLRPDEADMAAVSSAFSSYIQGGGLPVDIRVTGAGNTTLPRWLETLTSTFDLNASLPPLHTLSGVTTEAAGAAGAVGGEFALIEQMEVTAFELDLSNTTAAENRIGVTGGLRATLRNPLGASAPITVDRLSLASDLHMVENDTQWGEPFGHLEVPQDNLAITPADGNATGLIDLTMNLTGVVELLDGGKPFTEFARRLLDADIEADADTSVAGSLSMGLRGEMVSAVGTPMGMLTLSGLPLSETVDFRSLGSLRDSVNLTQWSIEGVDEAANGTAPKLHLAATVELKNPSFLGLSLGDVMWTLTRLDESRRGARIGQLVSSNLTIQPKPAVTTIGLLGSLEPPDGKSAGVFFSEVLNDMLLSDTPNPVTVRPSPMGRDTPWLSEVMGSMELQLSLGGLFEGSLLQSITLERLHFAPNADGTVELKGSLLLAARNPFTKVGDVSIDTISMTAQLVDSKSRPVGRLTIPTQPAQRIEADDTSNGTTNATDSLRARFVFRSSLTIDENSAAIGDFVSALTATEPVPSSALRLRLVGSSNVSVESPLGLIEIRDLPLDDPLPLTDGDEPAFDLASAKLGSIAFGSESGDEGVAFTTDLSVSVPPDFPLSVDLGNVLLALKYPAGGANESITLGELAMEPLRIRAGNNSLPVRGRLLPPDPEDPNAMLQASEFISTYLSGQNATVRVQGMSITIPGAETAPSWLEKAVKAIAVDITLPGRPQQTLQELRIADVSLRAADNATAGATFSASVRGGFTNPLGEGSEVTIKRARVDVAMRRPGAAGDETPLGTLTTPFMAVKTSVDESAQRNISLELQDGMIVFPDGGEGFGNLAADLLRSRDDDNLTSSTDDGPDEPEAEQRLVVGGWIEAEVDSPLGELTLRLPIETDVTMGGLSLSSQGGAGGLREWSVRDAANVDEGFVMEAAFDVVIGGDSDGSLASIELGDIELEVWYDSGRLAELVAPDVTLKRGANRLVVSGVIQEGITDRDTASAFLSAMVDRRPLPITIKGKKAADGEERSWVLMAMEALSLDVELSPSSRGDVAVAEGEGNGEGAGVGAVGVESGEFIVNVALDSLMFDFTTSAGGGGGGDGGGPVLQGKVEVVYQLPEAVDVTHTVIELNQTVELWRVKDSSLEPPLGRVSLSTTSVSPFTPSAEAFPAHNASRLRAFRASFADATLQIEEGEERERFQAFLASLVEESGPSMLELSGRASLAVRTAVGELEVREVDLTLRRDIEHIGGTLEDRSGVFGTEVTGGTADALIVETDLWIAHQGFLSAHLGDVSLDLYLPTDRSLESSLPDSMTILDESDGEGDTILVKVGEVTVPDLALVNGENRTTPVQVRIDPAPGPDLRAGTRVFLSRYVSQLPTELEVRGRGDSSRNELLKVLFGSWKSRMTIPGARNKLMQGVELDLRGIPLINMRVLARLTLRNAFPVDIAIRHINSSVYNDGTLIGRTIVDWRDDPSVIRAESTSTTRYYRLNTSISGAAIRTLFRSLVGTAYVESDGTVEFSVEDYIAYVDYDEKDVPTTF